MTQSFSPLHHRTCPAATSLDWKTYVVSAFKLSQILTRLIVSCCHVGKSMCEIVFGCSFNDKTILQSLIIQSTLCKRKPSDKLEILPIWLSTIRMTYNFRVSTGGQIRCSPLLFSYDLFSHFTNLSAFTFILNLSLIRITSYLPLSFTSWLHLCTQGLLEGVDPLSLKSLHKGQPRRFISLKPNTQEEGVNGKEEDAAAGKLHLKPRSLVSEQAEKRGWTIDYWPLFKSDPLK